MKQKISDALFGVQILGMILYCSGQFQKMTISVQGISPVWLICAEVFCIVNLSLGIRAFKENRSRINLQILATHLGWTIGILPLIVLLFVKKSEIDWSWYDNAIFGLVAFCTILTLVIGKYFHKGITDPIVRGVLAAIYRGIPHLCLGYKIMQRGGDGISCLTIWSAHGTVGTRLAQLGFSVSENGWQRIQKGLAIGEVANELTWLVVTIAWLMK